MAKKKNSKSKSSRKKTTKKVAKKSAGRKKSTSKKSTKKSSVKKVKKSSAKKTAKKSTKKTVKKAAKKTSSKITPSRKKASTKKTASKSKAPAKALSPSDLSDTYTLDMRVREGDLDEAILMKKKSGLKKKELLEFRKLLLEKRAEIVGDVASLQSSRGDGGDLSHMPVHMADVGSDNYEQEFTLGLMESERKLLAEIDDALERMSKGYYGICTITGQPIERPRLEIKPWAKYCIAVVRSRERLGYR